MAILEEETWEDYQKETQKILAKALGIAIIQNKVMKCKRVKQIVEVEVGTAKEAVSSAMTGLEKTVKGRFGGQVAAAPSKKSQMLVSFRIP